MYGTPFFQTRADEIVLQWVFTIGLSLSLSIDFLITLSLFILLHNCRTGAKGYVVLRLYSHTEALLDRLDQIIDSLILYAFEAGSMTL